MRARLPPSLDTRPLAAALMALALAIAGCTPHAARRGAPTPAGAASDGAPTRASASPVRGASRRPPAVTVVDLSPRFLAFYDSASTRRLDPDARWALWKRLYGFAAVPPTPFGDTLARRLLDQAWPRYPAALGRIRRGAGGLGFDPDTVLRRVANLLGCDGDVRVRLIAFVGGFEANAFAFTAHDGTPTVAIPLEAGEAEKSAVHEFAHVVHRSSGCAGITSGYAQTLPELVVSEGVAMRATEAVLPGHPAVYYVGGEESWLDSADARRQAILNGVASHLADSGAAAVQRFTFGRGTTGLGREAYYAGWAITGALMRSGVSLHDIATTPPARLRDLVRRGVDRAAGDGGP